METEDLKKRLNSPDPRERRDAISRLAENKALNAVGLLIKQLNYKEPSVRSAAAAALGKLGDRKAARQLIRLLSSSKEDLTVRSAAATALGELGDRQALEPLVKILREEQSSLRQVAAIALGKLGHLKAAEPLIRAMRDDDSFVRESAATGLSMLGDDLRKMVPSLRDLKSFDSGQRKDAVSQLGKSQNQWAGEVVQEILLTDVDHTVRKVAAESLKTAGEKGSIKYLIRALGDMHHEVRKAAADALESHGEEIGRVFLNTLNGEEQALELLVSKYSNQVVEPLIFVQRDQGENSKYIQENARKAIRKIGKMAINPLKELLKVQDQLVRQAVISAFVSIGKESVAPLSNVIRKSKHFTERINAIVVLGKLKDPVVVNTLLKMLRSPSAHEREEACIALGEIGDKQAATDLIDVVEANNEVPNVKKAAATALGRFKDEIRVIQPLINLLDDKEPIVRDAAETAIKEFGEEAVASLISKLNEIKEFLSQWEENYKDRHDKEPTPIEKEEIRRKWSSLHKKIIDLLGVFKAKKAVEALIPILEDEEIHLRIAAVHALGEIGDSRALKPLLGMLNSLEHEEENVRETIRQKVQDSLVKIGISDVPALVKMIEGQPLQVRVDTISALGIPGDSRALDSLISILKADEDLVVRQAAAEALGEIGDPRAIEPLEQVQKEEINFVTRILSPRVAKDFRSLKNIAANAKEKIQKNQQMAQNTELN